MPGQDPYRLLGIAPTATPEEIRAAFRRLVRQRHPDTGSGVEVGDVIDAYHLLIDPDARARYDAGRTRRIPVRRTTQPTRPAPTSDPSLCTTCGGSGLIRQVEGCPACAGSGSIIALDLRRARRLRCRPCGGRGEIVEMRPCEACGGRGTERATPR